MDGQRGWNISLRPEQSGGHFVEDIFNIAYLKYFFEFRFAFCSRQGIGTEKAQAIHKWILIRFNDNIWRHYAKKG